MSRKYSQGVCEDGAAILRDGQQITVDQIVILLNQAELWLNQATATTPKWQEQLIQLDSLNPDIVWMVYPDTPSAINKIEWVCIGFDEWPEDVKYEFYADTPEDAIDAAYQSVIGSGVQS